MEYDISYLAPADATRTLRSIRAGIKSAKQEIKSLEKEWTERLAAGSWVPLRIHQCIETYTEHLADLRQKLEMAEQMPMKLGRILTSSVP
jgi:ubiquinone biosynthesis protein UbiJ